MTTRKYYAMHYAGIYAYAFDSKGLRDYYCKHRSNRQFKPCSPEAAQNARHVKDMGDEKNWMGNDMFIISEYRAMTKEA